MDIRTAEQLTRKELRAGQWDRFTRCLETWYSVNPFYRHLLKQANVRPEDIKSYDDLHRIPMITKDDLIRDQQTKPPFGNRFTGDATDVYRIALTGGTSGGEKIVQPLTKAEVAVAAELTGNAYRWGGIGPEDIFVFNVGFSNHTGGWAFYEGARAVSRVPYVIGHESFEGRIDLMRIYGVNGMFATPSALNGLTTTCHDMGSAPRDLFPQLSYILLGAEGYPVEFAVRMEEEWGARVHENYGSTETMSAIAAATCEHGAVVDGERGMLHLHESSFLFEVIDPATGRHADAGEEGLFVITTLDKEASPMLRYNSNDRVTWMPHDACRCGRPFSGIKAGSIGRWDDMLKIKNTNVSPSQIDAIVFAVRGVVEYQGEVIIGPRGRDEARIKVAFEDDNTDPEVAQPLLEQLSKTLRARLEVRFDLVAVKRSELPTFSSGEKKARRWTDRRQEHLA